MIVSDDRTTKDALLNTLGEELAAAWVRFYAIEVVSRPGELEYDRALAAAAVVRGTRPLRPVAPEDRTRRLRYRGAHLVC